MALKRNIVSQQDVDRYHPSCIQCTKALTAGQHVVVIKHRQTGCVVQADVHETCFMKFAIDIHDGNEPLGKSGVKLTITEENINESHEALKVLAGVG